MSLAKNTAFNLCKTFSHSPSLFTRANVSRVSFSSATNRPVSQHGADDVRKREHVESDMAEKAKEGMERAKERTEEMKDKAKEKSVEMKENAKEKTEEMMDKTEEMKEKTNDMASKAANKAEEAKEKTKEKAYDMKEKTKDTAGTMAEKTKDTAGTMAEKTKDTAETMAEKAKETVKGAWDMAKDTTQKIKETVVGNNDDKGPIDDYMEDHMGRPGKDRSSRNEKAQAQAQAHGETMDADVADLRRRAGEEKKWK